MQILHATLHSLVRYTPARIACYWNRYTQHRGVAICINRSGGYGLHREPVNPHGIFYCRGSKMQLRELVASSTVIHCHDDAYPTRLSTAPDKKLIYHAHIGDIPKRLFHTRRFKYEPLVKHACITNGYGRCFDKEQERSGVVWGRLADILDLDHPVYKPCFEARSDPAKKLKVVFTYSNTREPGQKINAKAPIATKIALKLPIEGVDVKLITRVDFVESMNLKKEAHIVLDEIFSPYTHLSALEGASVGACVLTSFDQYTARELCDYVGAPIDSYPFIKVTPQTVRDKIEYFRDHPQEAVEIGRYSRDWMERYYHPKILLQKYLEFYGLE